MKNESKNSRKLIVIISIVAILVIALGVTYAFVTYSRNGTYNNKLIAGDIYMRYKEGSAINLSGAMPSSTYPSSTTGNYYEFQIIGKNTNTTKDITYNVKLAYGDQEAGKTRIPDQHLVFKLVEVVNNEEQTPALVEDQSYRTIPGTTIYTATIAKNTTNETTRTFRLYARISENVGIGTDTTFTMEEWNNLFASIKINVDGGFLSNQEENNPSGQATPASCFSTSENQDGSLTITGYDVGTCGEDVVIPSTVNGNSASGTSSNKNEKNVITRMPNNSEKKDNSVLNLDNSTRKTITAIGANAFRCASSTGKCGSFLNEQLDDSGESSPEEYDEDSLEESGELIGEKVRSLVIPNTIRSIGNNAFANNSISELTIPNSVETIGNFAFYHSNISTLVLEDGVEIIGAAAFSDNSVSNLTIPNSVTTIGDFAFLDNSISSLTIGNNVTTIGDSAFYNNSISELTLGNNVTTIGNSAFSYNSISSLTINSSDLSNITFGESCFASAGVTLTINNAISIPDEMFKESYITSLTLGNNVTTIGDSAFSYNSISSLTLGNNVTTIGDYAFYSNPISELTIPNSVTTIGNSAFSNNSISSLTIPNSVTTIGNYAFDSNSMSSLTLGNNVTTIGEYAFTYNSISELTIPNSVETIGDSAFYGNSISSLTINASDLSNITFGESSFDSTGVTLTINNAISIPDDMFSGSYITSLTLGNNVTTIGYSAFYNNSISELTIPNSVETIGDYAFADNSISSLTLGNNVTTIGDNAFYGSSISSLTINMNNLSGLNFYYAFGSADTVIINNATEIPANTFSVANINYLIVGNSVTTIGSYALAISTDQYIMLPSTITSIASDAFGSGSHYVVKFDKNCADIKAYQTYPFGNAPENIIGNGDMICETGESSIEIGGE